MHKSVSIILLNLLAFNVLSQNIEPAPDSLYPIRLKRAVIATGLVYGTALAGLDRLWYANHPRSSFHFFDDNDEWLQMDKAGHAYWAYQLSDIATEVLTDIGMPRRQAIWTGGLTGLVLQTPIEILDGFSAEWGASWGDMAANTGGSLLVLGQNLLWDEQRIRMKFSYLPSSWASKRPEALGKNHAERFLKDYNAQTYWLSASPLTFIPRYKHSPWACVSLALGYGIDEMIYARPHINTAQGYNARRTLYAGIDIDWSRIKTERKSLKILLKGLNMIRLPLPAVAWEEQKGFYLSVN